MDNSGNVTYKYEDVYLKLTYETALLIFIKRNGHLRVMLGTRNLKTVKLKTGQFMGSLLSSYDARHNKNNGNIAVIDLELEEARSFNIDRLVHVEYFGVIESEERMAEVYNIFTNFKSKYEAKVANSIGLDDLN